VPPNLIPLSISDGPLGLEFHLFQILGRVQDDKGGVGAG